MFSLIYVHKYSKYTQTVKFGEAWSLQFEYIGLAVDNALVIKMALVIF